ncbi:hypothetical protein Tco_0295269 [Tanacetum coccineum]
MSSAQVKYVDAAGWCAQVLWMKSQLADNDILYDKVLIFCDHTSAIAISKNLLLHSRTKHTNIRYHFIRDHNLKEDIKLHFVPTDLQIADIFTKLPAEPNLTRLVAKLGILNIDNVLPNKEKALNDSLTSILNFFKYSAEVDTTSNTITFTLSYPSKPLSFDLGDFSSITRLIYIENYTALPPKETVKVALATLGLTDEKNPQLSSQELINKSPLRIVRIIKVSIMIL